ncbi:DUF4238 domain-containing protein [Solilutibacter silvestris]|uniref:DUF4238 domain-containing protein n=1 Tax=Solilutibacter silvestris TaxID=1645665 RepID=UPI003D3368E1
MSGRRQHYLPQFLQRNFQSRKNRDAHYVYVHRNQGSFLTNTSNIGHERDFYGNPEESTADENITRAETVLGEILKRALSNGQVAQSEYALLVASISIRTKKMRDALKNAAPQIISAMSTAINAKKLAEEEYDKFFSDKRGIDDLIDIELGKVHLNRNQRATFKAIARAQLVQEAKSCRNETIDRIVSEFRGFFERLLNESENIADQSFLKIFKESSVPDKRVTLFEQLIYETYAASDSEFFILGDCGVVAIQSDGKVKLALGDVDDQLTMDEVWLPLSPKIAVIGRRPGNITKRSASEINMLSALLSSEFFLSHMPDDGQFKELKELIGSAEPLLSTEELLAISA